MGACWRHRQLNSPAWRRHDSGTERRPTASLQHTAQQRCAGRLFAAHPGTRGSSWGPGGRRLWSRGRTRGSEPDGRDREQQRPRWRQPQQAYSALPITKLGGVPAGQPSRAVQPPQDVRGSRGRSARPAPATAAARRRERRQPPPDPRHAPWCPWAPPPSAASSASCRWSPPASAPGPRCSGAAPRRPAPRPGAPAVADSWRVMPNL